jgi:Zn-dependent peptidase ImmA (M78 family)
VLSPITAKVNILRFHIQRLVTQLEITAPKIPSYEVTEQNTPQVIARKLRKEWKIATAVIPDMTRLLENKGIAILSFWFNTDRVDSRTLFTDNKYPVIIYNSSLLGDRLRFSLAYQLGHLIMHSSGNVDLEKDLGHEANLFAAEFLMPEKEIRDDYKEGLNMTRLSQLKKKWKVSMISLVYRADDLGFLTEMQKKYLVQLFNDLKIRKREPPELDVPIEKPRLVRQWLAQLRERNNLDIKGMAGFLRLRSEEFIEYYG